LVNKQNRSILPVVLQRNTLVMTLRALLVDLGLERQARRVELSQYLKDGRNAVATVPSVVVDGPKREVAPTTESVSTPSPSSRPTTTEVRSGDEQPRGLGGDGSCRTPLVFRFTRRNLAQDRAVELENPVSAGREGIGSSRCAESLIVRERHCCGRAAWFYRLH
jgi:hypothetical protein